MGPLYKDLKKEVSMEREAGSFIEEDGKLIPNENDEAMAERHGLKKKKEYKKKEVKEDGGYSKVSE